MGEEIGMQGDLNTAS